MSSDISFANRKLHCKKPANGNNNEVIVNWVSTHTHTHTHNFPRREREAASMYEWGEARERTKLQFDVRYKKLVFIVISFLAFIGLAASLRWRFPAHSPPPPTTSHWVPPLFLASFYGSALNAWNGVEKLFFYQRQNIAANSQAPPKSTRSNLFCFC